LTVLKIVPSVVGGAGAAFAGALVAAALVQLQLASRPISLEKTQDEREALLAELNDRIEDYITSGQVNREQLYNESLDRSI
jgi:hypothetical protein